MITKDQLKQIYPNAKEEAIEKYYIALIEAMKKFNINTPSRIAHFLAQLGHESGQLKYSKEIWGPTPTLAQRGYEGRVDLGNTEPGDGRKFMGRGPIQITGRNNYREVSRAIFGDDRLLDRPEILEQPEYGMLAAAYFWNSRGLNVFADKPESWFRFRRGDAKKPYNPIEWITLRVNGGQNGIVDRKDIYNRAKQVLGI